MAQQLVTRVDDELVEAIDGLVADGVVATRSEAVRMGLQRLIDRHRRDQVGEAIADGYRRVPQSETDTTWPDVATAQMIADEPW